MWRNNKVLVIDDNQQRRHDLKVLLDFLGETTLAGTSCDWQEQVKEENHGEDYVAVFIGDTMALGVSLGQLLKSIRTWSDEVSVLLWVADGSEKIGYEISFTRYFYKPQPLRTLEDTRMENLAVERETEGLLAEIVGTEAR